MKKHANFEVQGHRGMRGLYPENTLAGFEAAMALGVSAIECDILSTSDGVLIVYHDYAIHKNRCTYLGEPVAQQPLIYSLSFAEIQRYECGNPNPDFPSQIAIQDAHIPTLEELLHLSQTYPSVWLNLEIKRDALHSEWTAPPALLAKKILAHVKASGTADRIYFSSFDEEVLSAIRKLDAQVELALIFCDGERSPRNILESAQDLQVSVLSPEHSYLKNKEQVRRLQKMGFRIIPWTVNDPNRWKELIEMGVDGIVTDYPKNLMEYRTIARGPQI